jgi:2-polyprenyl-3-methyl-5-hydroxy-6-metoxy-1,4-benzoquinol methylase
MSDQTKLDDYFKHRTISDESYGKYTIPRYLIPFLPANKEARILDVGCGMGQFLGAMRELGYTNLHGIDINSEALEACKKKGLEVTKISDTRDFVVGEGEKFDWIIMSHVLEHIEKDWVIDTLKHIREKLMSKNGSFALMVPNGQSFTGTYWRYEDFTHHTVFTAGSCLYVLRAAGFGSIQFMDADGTSQMSFWKKCIIKFLIACYKKREDFWGLVLQTSYHKPSPRIYSFELKVLSRN